MNPSFLDQPLVLSLNRAWQVIGRRTVKQALVALNGGSGSVAPAVGLDIGYERNADGTWDFARVAFIHPRPWAEWLELPLRDFDQAVHTPRRALRAPTVIVAQHYDRMPVRLPRVTRQAIFERDGGVCQYTGRHVGRVGGNLDHVVPRSRGGRDTFENLVWAATAINSLKADRLPHEAGLRLLRRPRAPLPMPMAAVLREAKHRDWSHFIAG